MHGTKSLEIHTGFSASLLEVCRAEHRHVVGLGEAEDGVCVLYLFCAEIK